MFCVVIELQDGGRGYALYRVQQEWTRGYSEGKVQVIETIGTSRAVERELWRFLFSIDLTTSVDAWLLPFDHPLALMANEPRRVRMSSMDGLWLRIVDVKAALEARSYEGQGRLLFGLTDAKAPENEGVWSLDTTSGSAEVERSEEPADLKLDIAELGSIYLGGFSMTSLVAAGVVEEMTPGSASVADALFRTPRAAFCPEIF
jgi:predicted acetyltransferase